MRDGRGSALCGLRCPPRPVHGEAGQVIAASTNSVTETGIRTVNERWEFARPSLQPDQPVQPCHALVLPAPEQVFPHVMHGQRPVPAEALVERAQEHVHRKQADEWRMENGEWRLADSANSPTGRTYSPQSSWLSGTPTESAYCWASTRAGPSPLRYLRTCRQTPRRRASRWRSWHVNIAPSNRLCLDRICLRKRSGGPK